jgi:tetratricopeptide (TPR) repeat protein
VHHKTKYLKLALVLIAILISSPGANAQTPQERHERIKSAMNSGDLKAAIAELESSRATNAPLFAANSYDYLLGRLLEKSGQFAGASSSYQAVVSRGSVLRQYALWRLAEIARSMGDLALERERLRQLTLWSGTSLLRDAAILRLGQSFLESKDYTGAIAALKPLGDSAQKSSGREALALTGQAFLQAGRRDDAMTVFRRLVMQMPDASRPDDFALAAVRALDDLDGGDQSQKQSGQLSEAEHLLRASVYHFNRDFDAARMHYLALVERYPQSPALANALYQLGRGFYLQSRYDDALKYFQRVLDQYPDSTSARDALSFTAGTYNRMKRTDDAVSAYKRFIERFPDAPNPERVFVNIIDALHEAGRYQEALDWAQQTRLRSKGQIGEALALFAQTRIHLAQGAWQSVVADSAELRKLSDLGGTRVPSGTTLAEVTFLRGYALEALGKSDEAISEYLSIPDGRNEYYGKRATQRLQTLGGNSASRSLIESRANSLRLAAETAINAGQHDEGRRLAQSALRLKSGATADGGVLQLVLRAYDSIPSYKFRSFNLLPLGRQEMRGNSSTVKEGLEGHREIAEELFFLGLYDEGVPEFAAARAKSPPGADNLDRAQTPIVNQSDLDYTLAVYSLRGGLANRGVRFAEQIWKSVPQDYVLELAPREMVDMLYPLPYREPLLKHGPSRGVDPRFVISIARQESRFQPDAKSVAAARGMMQFISATADDVASQLGISGFTQNSLYNADVAILFGSQYLANLFKQFPNQSQAVAASYNGGPDNMARWLGRSKSNDADRYVAEIGFTQTKDYVFKVMANFWIYQQLYDEKLERK